MPCFKCGSSNVAISFYKRKELAKNSPTRGKNMKWVDIKVKEVKCKDCQSSEMTYG